MKTTNSQKLGYIFIDIFLQWGLSVPVVYKIDDVNTQEYTSTRCTQHSNGRQAYRSRDCDNSSTCSHDVPSLYLTFNVSLKLLDTTKIIIGGTQGANVWKIEIAVAWTLAFCRSCL